jgi:glycosyltransferase involved in cell wall biosynthesis
MFVSVITPNFNCEKYIAQTIESVITQTYENWEMIIVDDCSTDNSINIIEKYVNNEKRIKLIKLDKNSGVSNARNIGLQNAKGDYIAFLDSDDFWDKNKLQEQIGFIKDQNIPLSYTSYIKIDEKGEKIGEIKAPESVDYKKMLKSNFIACSSAIVKKEIITFNDAKFPKLKLQEDHAFWLSILKRGHIAYGLNKPLLFYRVRQDSASSNKLIAAKYQWKLYREIEKLSFIKSLWYFFNYAVYGFKKYLK